MGYSEEGPERGVAQRIYISGLFSLGYSLGDPSLWALLSWVILCAISSACVTLMPLMPRCLHWCEQILNTNAERALALS